MPWFRNQPVDGAQPDDTAQPDHTAPAVAAPQPWWAATVDDAGAPPVPDFDAIVGGRTSTDAPTPTPTPTVPAPVVPAPVVPAPVAPATTPERRTVLGGLPRTIGTVALPDTTGFAPVTPTAIAAVPAFGDSDPFEPAEPVELIELTEPVAVPVGVTPDTIDATEADADKVDAVAASAVAADAVAADGADGNGDPLVVGFDAIPVDAAETADSIPTNGERDEVEYPEPIVPRAFAVHAGTHAMAEETDLTPADLTPADEATTDEAPTNEAPFEDAPTDDAPSTLSPLDLDVPFDPAGADDVDEYPLPPSDEDVPVPVAEIGLSFGERIERLIAAAVAEADNTRTDAQHEAEQVLQTAQLDAEHTVAAAQRQSAEIMASAQRRCDADLAAAQRTREEAERALAEARTEADELRRHARDEVAELRTEVDLHAQAMLARTHADTTRTLAAARAELEEIAMRKAELEGQMSAIRALLSDTVVEPLPPLADAIEPATVTGPADLELAEAAEDEDAPTVA
jgi:F0F1-type ATP synthase membrane subunit b/b'